jgi:hypothetical protein
VNPLYKGDLQLAEYIEERIKNRALRPSSAAARKIKLSRIDYGSLYDSTDFKYTRNRYDRSYQSRRTSNDNTHTNMKARIDADKYKLLTQQLKNIAKMQHAHRRP